MGSNTSINDYSIIRNFGTSGSTGTNSVYIKSNTSDSYTLGIDNTGQVETITVTPQWQRFSYSVTNSDRLQISLRGGGQTVSAYADVSMWGGSLENGTYVTSYIPTSSAAVTRVKDEVFNGGNQYIFNDSEGTLFLDNYDFKSSVNPEITLSNGAASNRITLVYYPSSNQLRFFISSNNVVQADQFVSYTYSQRNKIALRYKQNDFKAYINGTQVFSDTSGNTPVGLSRFDFSKYDHTNGFFEGEIYQTTIYNEALSASELATITTI